MITPHSMVRSMADNAFLASAATRQNVDLRNLSSVIAPVSAAISSWPSGGGTPVSVF
jgi:hypothetical protein